MTAEARTRWLPAATPADHAERMWAHAVHGNPFRGEADLEAAVGGAPALAALQAEYGAAVEAALSEPGRFDAQQGRVSNRYTVLHAVATA